VGDMGHGALRGANDIVWRLKRHDILTYVWLELDHKQPYKVGKEKKEKIYKNKISENLRKK